MKSLGRDAAELSALADHLTAHGLVLEMLAGPCTRRGRRTAEAVEAARADFADLRGADDIPRPATSAAGGRRPDDPITQTPAGP